MVRDYEGFKSEVFKLSTIDLNAYKERQMKRRIDSLISKNGFKGYNDYCIELRKKSERYKEFINYMTINVSEFFRNTQQWKVLEKEVFPLLSDNYKKRIKIWSAACSTGDEPYSLAMVLSRHIPLSNIDIIATDIDNKILSQAKMGLYNEKSIAGVPTDLKNKYFEVVGNSYKISDEIKRCIKFKQHNLLKDAYPSDMDLIVCRNVLIYFTEDAKSEIYKRFNGALGRQGMLFVGSTEQIIQCSKYNFETIQSFFYKKTDNL